jgi:hypothetical protein
MRKLSTGEDSTLCAHRKMAVAVFGADTNCCPGCGAKVEET